MEWFYFLDDKKMNKKGQIDQLGNLIIPLIGVGIVLVVGFLIMAEAKDQVFTLESGDWCDAASASTLLGAYSLSRSGSTVECCNSTWCSGNAGYQYNLSENLCCNATSNPIGNCTSGQTTTATSGLDCSVGNTSGARLTSAWNGTQSTQEAMSDIPGWLPIIVITVIGALLIGMVSFFRR